MRIPYNQVMRHPTRGVLDRSKRIGFKNVYVEMTPTSESPKYLHACIGGFLDGVVKNVRDKSGVLVAYCEKCMKMFIDKNTLEQFRLEHRERPAGVNYGG